MTLSSKAVFSNRKVEAMNNAVTHSLRTLSEQELASVTGARDRDYCRDYDYKHHRWRHRWDHHQGYDSYCEHHRYHDHDHHHRY